MSLYDSLDTGDLLLFHGTAKVSCCIEFFTSSKYSHIGMVLKDQTYIQPALTGLYVWQSGKEGFPEVEDHKIFDGVQISPLDKVIDDYGIGNVYVRKLILNTPLDTKLLTKIHHEIHHHKYDMNILT